MNRSDHWQNLALLGELLLTPGSALTLTTVYHSSQEIAHEFLPFVALSGLRFLKTIDFYGLIHARPAVIL